MNQRFLTKLRNALGIAVLLCALMSAETASAQNYLPPNEALQVVITTLNGLNSTATPADKVVVAPINTLQKGATIADDNHLKTGVYTEYLKRLGTLLKQATPTAAAIDNVYNAMVQDGISVVILDPVKQQVIDLLSN